MVYKEGLKSSNTDNTSYSQIRKVDFISPNLPFCSPGKKIVFCHHTGRPKRAKILYTRKEIKVKEKKNEKKKKVLYIDKSEIKYTREHTSCFSQLRNAQKL